MVLFFLLLPVSYFIGWLTDGHVIDFHVVMWWPPVTEDIFIIGLNYRIVFNCYFGSIAITSIC